jgi:hypothetical protein
MLACKAMLDRPNQHWPDSLLDDLRTYVHVVLDMTIDISRHEDHGLLPSFLAQRYMVLKARFADRPCLLMLPRPGAEETPAAIAKHRTQLRKSLGPEIVIFVTNALSNHNRHRLIAHRVSFIVPGNQLFVPELAMDLREHFRAESETPPETLTPAAQLIVLATLLGHRFDQETPTSLAGRYHYSAMSMGRALDELRRHDLVDVEPEGKHLLVSMRLNKQDLWHLASPLLRSPVRKRRRIPRPPAEFDARIAGESALAALTDLSHPPVEVRAIAASEWKTLAKRYNLDRHTRWDEKMIELETWSYDPSLLSDKATVDPISLWLSLPDAADERLSQAKENLLRQAGL